MLGRAAMSFLSTLALVGFGCSRSQPSSVQAPISAAPSSSVAATPASAASSTAPAHASIVVLCATWTIACRDVDRALADPALVGAMTGRVDVKRIDCSDDADPAVAAAEKRYETKGILPTLVVYDPTGNEVGRMQGADELGRLRPLVEAALAR
jgi:hypothetical protein